MLLITRNTQDSRRRILILHGRIVGVWIDLLERECLETARSGLHVVLDLTGVTAVGHAGLKVLARLSREGVTLTGCPALIADMLEQEGVDVGGRSDEGVGA
jgi:anti-anti-sigma regulatory factor